MKFTALCAATGALALLALPATVQAQTPLLSATVGSGTAESFLILDFEDGNAADTYAFGYKYDPATSPNALTMINALQSANIGFGATPTYYPSFGEDIISAFSYNNLGENGFVNNGYWSYYVSSDGQNWGYTNDSVDTRPLTNGSYDGWAWDAGADPLPVTPLAASVPEASPCWLLLAALPLLWGVRRRAQRL